MTGSRARPALRHNDRNRGDDDRTLPPGPGAAAHNFRCSTRPHPADDIVRQPMPASRTFGRSAVGPPGRSLTPTPDHGACPPAPGTAKKAQTTTVPGLVTAPVLQG